jgi:DNA polymerase II small subunit
MNTKEIINFYLENDILISPELLETTTDKETDKEKIIPIKSNFIVMNDDVLEIINSKTPINIDDYEISLLLKEKHNNSKLYDKFREYIYQNKNNKEIKSEKDKDKSEKDKDMPIGKTQNINSDNKEIINPSSGNELENNNKVIFEQNLIKEQNLEGVSILDYDKLFEQKIRFLEQHRARLQFNYTEKSHKRTVADFVGHFNSRFKDIEKILRVRQELQGLTSISRILSKKEKEKVSLIGIVYDKATTKNGNTILTIEDPTGVIKVVVSKNKEELNNLVQEIQLDEIIGIIGTYDGIVFVNNILIPDIPLTKELKKSSEEGYFVVIADPQLGNKLFLEKEFEKLISWINGEVGSDIQKDIASKIKYLFIVGDLVDGVGIYPDQEYDLKIIDITDQYIAFANYLKKMPKIPIFVCPGNHDVGRISEPQPGFKDEYSKAVWSIPNVIPVSNPSIINIYARPEQNFEGFDVLLYHGYSFFYYFGHVPNIRQKGGPKRSDLVMKYLLQRRHLAPTHASSLYIPDPKKDPLVLDKIPDFFFTGHVHRATVNNYRNITCINASCWVSKSDEQERRGIEPQPARAFIINMQTREVKVMNFLSKEDQEKESAGEQNG